MTDPFHQAYRDCRRAWIRLQRAEIRLGQLQEGRVPRPDSSSISYPRATFEIAVGRYANAQAAFASAWDRVSRQLDPWPIRTEAHLDLSVEQADSAVRGLIAAGLISDDHDFFREGRVDPRRILEAFLAACPAAVV